ncbi:MAG: nuclear transport factor 2 family protein [Carboxylicivirga sp.]|jgi:hypothetical protein|nr:nuclear transport factor 2 family protein [Carboxylicivirga sp.]
METINSIGIDKKTAPILDVLDQLIKAQEKGDLKTFSSCFAQDENTVNIGTDLDEIWYNWGSFYDWMQSAIHNRSDYSITSKDTRIQLSKSEDVAWYSQLLDTCLETKGEPFSIEGFRHTGVLEKRNDQWLIVQSHISIPFNAKSINE